MSSFPDIAKKERGRGRLQGGKGERTIAGRWGDRGMRRDRLLVIGTGDDEHTCLPSLPHSPTNTFLVCVIKGERTQSHC